MTEVVHETDSSSGMGFFMGMVLLVIFGIFVLFYGLPYLRNSFGGAVQIKVPDKIDVNVNQPAK